MSSSSINFQSSFSSQRGNYRLPSKNGGSILCSVASKDACFLRARHHHPTTRSSVVTLIDQVEKASFSTGKFGKFGGSFVPETLVDCLNKLAHEFCSVLHDSQFQTFGLTCSVVMGDVDMERQSSNVFLMKHLGAQVKTVVGTYRDATSEAIRDWVRDLDKSYYLAGTAVGPYPCPTMVREFQLIIGKETRKQAMEKWGGKPDVLVACVGGGSNALGIFHEFVRDEGVRLIGVEAAGRGMDTGKHTATFAKGDIGVYHGAMTYLLQDDEGQINEPYSIGVGLEYPGVSPELSFLRDIGRAEFYTITDEEALDAYTLLSRLEGILPSLEAAHALAYLEKLCGTLPNGTKVVVNCSGHGEGCGNSLSVSTRASRKTLRRPSLRNMSIGNYSIK